MNVDISTLLSILLYVSIIILIIIFIILGIKLIRTLKKVDNVIDDVNSKMEKVDGVFNIIDKTADYASLISDKVINGISGLISTLFKKRKGNDSDE